jgi:preprotein translocase subunit SecD
VANHRLGGPATVLIVAAVVLIAACSHPGPKSDASYFTIRPVTRQVPPPCRSPALAERNSEGEGACFELGPVAVDATDVASAAVTASPSTSAPEVQFQFSGRGTDRFNALARTVGVGGQVAIVVDGAVASAPRLDTTEFPGSGVVTGLTPDAAAWLVHRLNHH